MRILITGANGFVGCYVAKYLLGKGHNVVATGKGGCRLPFSNNIHFSYYDMDFTDAGSVKTVFEETLPEAIIHSGAISKPDECELNKENAWNINVQGTINLLAEAEKLNTRFLFMSTDFVFDGERGMYTEEDIPKPVNYYGETKLAAEKKVMAYSHLWAIVRTVLVYGKPLTGRDNLLTIVKRKLEKGEEYCVVSDQVRTPTYVEDLAQGILSVIEEKAEGIFHISGEEVTTPYEMACKTALMLGYDVSLIKEVTAENFSQPARRPLKTGFNIGKAKSVLGYHPVSFGEGLRKTFREND
ncbi:MAG: SDR family oxidoreductase [Chitinophagaceae bacterium]|nr:SDR family oxidoreductase [Chitinophagaceae bacterium]